MEEPVVEEPVVEDPVGLRQLRQGESWSKVAGQEPSTRKSVQVALARGSVQSDTSVEDSAGPLVTRLEL